MIESSDLARFSDLYRKYHLDAYRYALSLCGREAQAEDLAAEAFLRIWDSPAPVRLATVRSYLVAIVRNLYLESRRKLGRESALEDDVQDGRDFAAEQESRAEWLRLRPLLDELPEVTRSALIMQSVLEMPYAEIEAVLGVPAAALKARVYRARMQLAAQMKREETKR